MGFTNSVFINLWYCNYSHGPHASGCRHNSNGSLLTRVYRWIQYDISIATWNLNHKKLQCRNSSINNTLRGRVWVCSFLITTTNDIRYSDFQSCFFRKHENQLLGIWYQIIATQPSPKWQTHNFTTLCFYNGSFNQSHFPLKHVCCLYMLYFE